MNTLDALFLAGGLLHVNHTAADYLINAALYYGPGVLLTAGLAVAWRTWQRAVDWRHDRADRRHYTAVAFRLNRVWDQADALLALPEDQLLAHLEAHHAVEADHAKEEGR